MGNENDYSIVNINTLQPSQSLSNTLQTRTDFSNKTLQVFHRGEEVEISKPSQRVNRHVKAIELPKGFEIVIDPNGRVSKYAYGKLFPAEVMDYEIEFYFLKRYEHLIKKSSRAEGKTKVAVYRARVKLHYKNLIPHIAPRIAKGWNRWGEDILDLFISEKIHHILWGSGNCGKSIILALLLYIKWRVNPTKRMVVIAAKVAKDSTARVFGYMKEIHARAPIDRHHPITIIDSKDEKGIFSTIVDEATNKRIKNDRGCIILLPIKVNAKQGELGANLMGKHPDDKLILAFDECQEVLGSILEMKIFSNWYTNPNLEIHAWGNPTPVNYNVKESWDLLFKLGASFLSIATLRRYEKRCDKTDKWGTFDTEVLRLTMLDSPKDDMEESSNKIMGEDGIKRNRLYFLAGMDAVKQIAEKVPQHSSAWYSQVLGFPFIDTEGESVLGILSPHSIKESQRYPLIWKNPKALEWFMGVDPSLTGDRDDCSIICGCVGLMLDGRIGIDLRHGEYHRIVKPVEGEEFADVTIEVMFSLSRMLRIPLENIAIEVHGTGEVFRYALENHIENGKWASDRARGQTYHVISPNISPTERLLFKDLGRMQPSKDIVNDIVTEYCMAVRCAVLNRQLFNVPEAVLRQFYTRELQRTPGGKFKAEAKLSMYKKGIASPSLADSLCNLIEVMRRRAKFRYKFYNKASYTNALGDAYEAQKLREGTLDRMGLVSRMLQLDVNLGTGNRMKKEESPLKGDFNIVGV